MAFRIGVPTEYPRVRSRDSLQLNNEDTHQYVLHRIFLLQKIQKFTAKRFIVKVVVQKLLWCENSNVFMFYQDFKSQSR